MAEYDGISEFLKVAPQRIQDAKKLMEGVASTPQRQGIATQHLRAALYLSGYAIECVLKAYVIDRQPSTRTLTEAMNRRRSAGEQLRGEPLPDIQGARGHNLPLLLLLTDLEAALDSNRDRKKDWAVCLGWKSSWRYDPSSPSQQSAEDFVAAAERLCRWVERRL